MVILTAQKIQNDYKQIITQDIRNTLTETLTEVQAKDIIVNVTEFDDAVVAIEKQVKMIVDDTLIKVSDIKTFIKKQMFLFSLAKANKDVFTLEPSLKAAALNAAPSKMTEAEMIQFLEVNADTQAKKAVVERIQNAFIERREEIARNINIATAENITQISASYKDGSTLDFIKNNKGIHIVNGQKGSGKTEVIIDLFKSDMQNANYPIFVNASRALSESMIDKTLEGVFYKNIISNMETSDSYSMLRKGILGVVNTVFMNNDLSMQRRYAKTLIVDEIEEVLNHMCGKAVGRGKLEDQREIFERLENLINNVENVVLTDAMFSRNTLELINKMNTEGKKIYLHEQESQFSKPVVRYMTEAMNMATTQKAIESSKVGVFCDGSHSEVKSKFNAVIEALKGKKSHSVIDAHFMSDRTKAVALNNKSEFSANNDVIFYNSAAKCGLSIIDNDYTETSLFACKTVSPNELVQASARLRCTKTVNISFDSRGGRVEPLTPFSVLNKVMLAEMNLLSITQQKHNELMTDKHVQNVINRITYKNNLNNDYINTTLILLETLGYEVQYINDNEEQVKQGSQARRAGNKVEKYMRQSNVIAAKKINESEAEQIKKSGEHNSQQSKNMLESFNIRTQYNVETIDLDLMKFDNAGRGRKVLNNLKLLRTDNVTRLNGEKQIAKMMFNKLLETTGMNAETFGKYSAHEADVFQDFILNGEIIINKTKTIKARTAFRISFPDCRICDKSSMKTVSGILKNMFNVKTPENTQVRTKGKYIYEAKPEAKTEAYYLQATK